MKVITVKLFRCLMIMTVNRKEAPANFVPAAAVKRGGQVLLLWTGRKGLVGGLDNLRLKIKEVSLKKSFLFPIVYTLIFFIHILYIWIKKFYIT